MLQDKEPSLKQYLLISDFDQTLSFHDSGLVLSEMLGISGFLEKINGLSQIHLVQQGGELAYLLQHDPEFRRVRKHHLIEAGKRIRLKQNIHLLSRMLADLDGHHFSYYVVSAASMLLGVPVMIVALFVRGPLMIPAIGVAAFFLLLNTAPLNAAVINSVGAHIRVTALAVNIFIIHLLGDVPSPTMMGWVADKRSLQAAFILPVIAMGISSAILFYGMKFAPAVAVNGKKAFTTEDTK